MIDINKEEYYKIPHEKETTRFRLMQLNEMGLSEISEGEFGIPDVISGLFVENLWNWSDK